VPAVLAALAGKEIDKGEPIAVTVVHGGGRGSTVEHQIRSLDATIKTAEAELKNAKRLARKGLYDDDDLAETKEEVEKKIATAQEKKERLKADPKTINPEPLSADYQVQLIELVEQVSDESTPVEWRRELLDSAGVERIYVDMPDLRIHLRD
jgi:predicted Zn-dependent protease